jgi:hypothetical protein
MLPVQVGKYKILPQALYVIGLLLAGKHRKQVQDELSQMHISQRLSALFESFCWKRRGKITTRIFLVHR